MSGEWDGLRAAAEAATAGPWVVCDGVSHAHDLEMTVCAEEHLPIAALADEWWRPGDPGEPECASDARYIAAASPDVVLGLLNRLAEVEGQLERTEQQIHEPGGFIDGVVDLTERIDAVRAVTREWEHVPPAATCGCARCDLIDDVRRALDGPQDDAGADLSASGAESDHGGRRDGEGLA